MAIAVHRPMSSDADRSPRPEPPTRPTEPPLQRIRTALVEAICDGTHRPFSEEALAARRDATQRLRQLIQSYTVYIKDRGMPPERAVGFMKALVHDTEIPCQRPLLALENEIMHWCIDAYYEGGDKG
jgi:hypothetical protein